MAGRNIGRRGTETGVDGEDSVSKAFHHSLLVGRDELGDTPEKVVSRIASVNLI